MHIDNDYDPSIVRNVSVEEVDGKTKKEYSPKHILCIAKSGHGKSILIEQLVEKEYNRGAVVIILTSQKNVFEECYAGFKPTADFHLEFLKTISHQARAIPIKIYHPFTYHIKEENRIPKDINFFQFNIKTLDESDFCILSERMANTDIVRSLNFAIKRLKPEQGVYDFIYNIEEYSQTEGVFYKGKVIQKRVQPLFIKAGFNVDKKDVKEVASYFYDILESNAIIGSADSPYLINFEEMVKDQKHYHILTTKYLQNEKLTYFTIAKFIKDINKISDKVKKRIVFVIDEIRNFCPAETQSNYVVYTSNLISKYLAEMRSKFKYGGMVVAGTQIYGEVLENVADSFMEHYIGALGSITDLGRLRKNLTFKRDLVQNITTMPRGHFFCLQDPEQTIFKADLPTHGHKHISMDYLDDCAKLKLLGNYDEIVNYFENVKSKKIEEMKQLAQIEEKEQKRKIDVAFAFSQKNSKDKDKLETMKSRFAVEKEEKKVRIKNRVIELYNEGMITTTRPIADKITQEIGKISEETVRKIIKSYKEESAMQETSEPVTELQQDN